MFGWSTKIDVTDFKAKACTAQQRLAYRNNELQGKVARLSKEVFEKYTKGDVEMAKIKVENIIALKREILLHSLLTQYLASVEQRIEFLNNEKTCPPNMESYIASIIYCYGKVDVDEMGYFKTVFEKKYKKSISTIMNACERRITDLLVPVVPTEAEVNNCLHDILAKNGVQMQPTVPSVTVPGVGVPPAPVPNMPGFGMPGMDRNPMAPVPPMAPMPGMDSNPMPPMPPMGGSNDNNPVMPPMPPIPGPQPGGLGPSNPPNGGGFFPMISLVCFIVEIYTMVD